MTAGRRLLYFASFVCLAATAALAAGHSCRTSIASLLVASAIAASVAGAPGLVRWRAWPLVFVLLPLGAYLLARAQVTPPADVGGAGGRMGYLLDQTADGIGLYQSDRFPLDVAGKPALGLAVSLVVYLIVGLAAFSALSRRRPVLGIAMLIAPLGFGSTVDDSGRAVLLTVAFVVFSGCLLVTSLSLERHRLRPTGLLAGAAAGLGAALLALVIVSVTPVAAGQPWMNWETIGEAPNLTFDWMENYPSLLDPQTDATVMRVKAPAASYWRANALDSFDGVAWSSSRTMGEESSPLPRSASSVYQVPPDVPEPPGRLVSETFSVESVSTDYLFVGGSPRSVRLEDTAPLRLTPQRALGTGSLLGPKLTYTVTAWVPSVTPADLERSRPDYPPDILGSYISLPFPSLAELSSLLPMGAWQGTLDGTSRSWGEDTWSAWVAGTPALEEWSDLYRLNQEIVGDPTGPYEATLAIRDYLQANYTYSLEPPETDSRSPYAAFLFETKTGYCQHFAGAMAVLLRFNGIPARVAVGFASGDRGKDGVFVVSRSVAQPESFRGRPGKQSERVAEPAQRVTEPAHASERTRHPRGDRWSAG
jgi:transglutaminase-like putative cysteine protease